jgi:hypothetical protein
MQGDCGARNARRGGSYSVYFHLPSPCLGINRLERMNYDEQLYIRVRHLLSEEASFFASCSMSGRLSRRPGVITSVVRVAPGRSMFNWVVYERHDALLEHYETIAQVYDDAGVRAWAVWVDSGDELAVRELSRRVSTIAPMVYPRPPSRPCSITGPIRAVMVSPRGCWRRCCVMHRGAACGLHPCRLVLPVRVSMPPSATATWASWGCGNAAIWHGNPA